jgi:FKBP-type peptidyl-prolyl cis-trans isomerase
LATGLLAGPALAEDAPALEDAADRTSYSLGFQMGRDLKRQDVTMDRDALLKGLADGQSGAEPLMTPDAMRTLLTEVKRRIMAKMREERQAKTEALKQAGIAFLEENRSKPGVQSTESGLQYRVITEGKGARPGPTDRVRVHYRGKTIEGREFDSSYKRGEPAEFALNGVIRGWGEGLQLMTEGSKYELFIPYELAYNRRGPLAYQALIFEVELIAVNPEAEESDAGVPSE